MQRVADSIVKALPSSIRGRFSERQRSSLPCCSLCCTYLCLQAFCQTLAKHSSTATTSTLLGYLRVCFWRSPLTALRDGALRLAIHKAVLLECDVMFAHLLVSTALLRNQASLTRPLRFCLCVTCATNLGDCKAATTTSARSAASTEKATSCAI